MNSLKFYIIIASFVFAVDYQSEIQPIWNANCGGCHLSNSSGGLNLSNYESLMSNDVIEAGNHLESELYDRITRPESAQGDMPPNGSLAQSEIDLIALWINEGALFEEPISGCMDSNAISCTDQPDPEDTDDYEEFILYFPECNTCSDSDPCGNYFNPDATVDNGLCMYNVIPSENEFTIDATDEGFNIDWSAFTPPVEITQYTLQRCLDPDGDSDDDGELEYENCVMIIPINSFYLETSFFDEYTEEIAFLKYTLYVDYPNNNFWGSAHGYYYYEESSGTLGDVNQDGIINVIDIVLIVNHVLDTVSLDSSAQLWAADYNGDGTINVVDIVGIVNLILN